MVWLSDNYIYRRAINVQAPEEIPSGHKLQIVLPPEVDAQGKLRDDFEDIEIIRELDNTAMNRTTAQASDGSVTVVFSTTSQIVSGDQSYHVYYGNLGLIEPPTRGISPIVQYPVTTYPNEGLISFQRPGEWWVDGKSSTEGSRASLTAFMDDILITFSSGPDRGIAEVQVAGEDSWTAVDTFATTPGLVTHSIIGSNSFDLQHLKIKVSGRANTAASDVIIDLLSISFSKPHSHSLELEEVNLDAL